MGPIYISKSDGRSSWRFEIRSDVSAGTRSLGTGTTLVTGSRSRGLITRVSFEIAPSQLSSPLKHNIWRERAIGQRARMVASQSTILWPLSWERAPLHTRPFLPFPRRYSPNKLMFTQRVVVKDVPHLMLHKIIFSVPKGGLRSCWESVYR